MPPGGSLTRCWPESARRRCGEEAIQHPTPDLDLHLGGELAHRHEEQAERGVGEVVLL